MSTHAGSASRLDAAVANAETVPAADLARLPTPSITGPTVGVADNDGLRELSFAVTQAPTNAMLCAPHYTIIGRDAHDHTAYGITQLLDGPAVRTTVALLDNADPTRTTTYVLQGAANLLTSSHVGC